MEPVIPYKNEVVKQLYEDTKEFLTDIDIQNALNNIEQEERRIIEREAFTLYHKYNEHTFVEISKLKWQEIQRILKLPEFKKKLKDCTSRLDNYIFIKESLEIIIPTGGCMEETIYLFDDFASKKYKQQREELDKQIKPIKYFENVLKERRK